MNSVIEPSIRTVYGESSFEGFPAALRVGKTLYVGMQSELVEEGVSIGQQTHSVFSSFESLIERSGLSMEDLIKLHTYYVYDGEGKDVTTYWEGMTNVRLEYLANPGPAATALRVKGIANGQSITIDGIASFDSDRQRLMPSHAWDWSIPTPFSQGWRIGNKVYVGGQISADRNGAALNPNEAVPQVKNTLEYIRHVLLEAGGDWGDVSLLKVAYRHTGDGVEAKALLNTILDIIKEELPGKEVAITCFGVDLLYEGLLLEIDAIAELQSSKSEIHFSDANNWVQLPDFSPAIRTNNEVYLGGVSTPGGASLVAQTESSMERLLALLDEADCSSDNLVKLNVFYQGSESSVDVDTAEIARVVSEYLTNNRPVLSILRVAGLPLEGQRIQIDGSAIVS